MGHLATERPLLLFNKFDMKKILFLGYNRDQTSLIDKIQLHKKNWSVEQTEKKIDLNLAQNFIQLSLRL